GLGRKSLCSLQWSSFPPGSLRQLATSRTAAYTESHVQPVYQPYLTTCQGHRLCSTYRTIYRVAYRQAYKQLPQPVPSCCPGWSRLPGDAVPMFCLAALCWVPCQNGGSCTFPGRCACPPGWTGGKPVCYASTRTPTRTPTRIAPGQRCPMVWPGKDGKLGSQGSSDFSLAASVLPALMCSPGIHIFSLLLLRARSV
uniref:Uncharacterized protein n=1 Tax=Buteo japonicus TaxID=224669 RepID=A0A8B9YWB4_9AVES